VSAVRVFVPALLLAGLTAPVALAASARPLTSHPVITVSSAPRIRPPVPPRNRAESREGNLPLTLLGAISLLLVLVPTRKLLLRTTPGMLGFAAHPVWPVPRPGIGPGPCSALSFEEGLSSTTGVGVAGPGAEGFMRAAFVELLTRADRKVVLSRAELNRLFEGSFSTDLLDALSPRLHVCDLLEEAIAYLELRMLQETGRTYWITTPDAAEEVVLPLLSRASGHRLRVLLFGEWRHGPTTVIEADGTVPGHPGPVPTLTSAEAVERLHLYALTDR
jgi:hypothetical protein